jgi:hypothetical protein
MDERLATKMGGRSNTFSMRRLSPLKLVRLFPIEENYVLTRDRTGGLNACYDMPDRRRVSGHTHCCGALAGHHNNLNKTGIQKALRFFVQRANAFDLRMNDQFANVCESNQHARHRSRDGDQPGHRIHCRA